MQSSFWKGLSVLVTGHTGFKGSWLSFLLAELGAKVHGYSLPPASSKNLFQAACLHDYLASNVLADIRDLRKLSEAIQATQPDIIFHLAAQPLVIDSYKNPIDTWTSNVIGTAHVLEATRSSNCTSAIVVITTDKVYENREWVWGYRESERLGGKDPYSASKACAELVVNSYRHSFFNQNSKSMIATARAGNIIGGGDWSDHRLVPDIIRAVENGQTLLIRSPHSTRPWQHVIEPLTGYLMLGQKLLEKKKEFSSAWNFGPPDTACKSVSYLCEEAKKYYGSELSVEYVNSEAMHYEAKFLKLDSSKAFSELGWSTRLTIEESLAMTFSWHRRLHDGASALSLMKEQAEYYQR